MNPASAHDDGCMAKLKSYIDLVGGCGIVCMFDACNDDDDPNGDGHGTGIVGDATEFVSAWKAVDRVFALYGEVKYEAFK